MLLSVGAGGRPNTHQSKVTLRRSNSVQAPQVFSGSTPHLSLFFSSKFSLVERDLRKNRQSDESCVSSQSLPSVFPFLQALLGRGRQMRKIFQPRCRFSSSMQVFVDRTPLESRRVRPSGSVRRVLTRPRRNCRSNSLNFHAERSRFEEGNLFTSGRCPDCLSADLDITSWIQLQPASNPINFKSESRGFAGTYISRVHEHVMLEDKNVPSKAYLRVFSSTWDGEGQSGGDSQERRLGQTSHATSRSSRALLIRQHVNDGYAHRASSSHG